jgi:hypothetical protein
MLNSQYTSVLLDVLEHKHDFPMCSVLLGLMEKVHHTRRCREDSIFNAEKGTRSLYLLCIRERCCPTGIYVIGYSSCWSCSHVFLCFLFQSQRLLLS